MPKKQHLNGIDEVSELLGRLKEITTNLEKGQQEIKKSLNSLEKHLVKINGTVGSHQEKIGECGQRFNNIEKDLEVTATTLKEKVIDERSWKRIKIGVYVSVGLAVLAIAAQFILHGR